MRSTCNLLLLFVLAVVAIAVPVLAQESSDYPAACEASKVTKADVDRAHTVFLSGKQFLEEANYDKAISYFKDAYSIDCSVHAILPIIATAYERKGDKAEAVRALEEYVRRAPNAPDHEVLSRRIKNLKDQIARDQATTASAATPAPSASSAAPPVTAPSGEAPPPVAPLATSPTPAQSQGHTALPWVLVGVGGAAVITGVVLYAVGAGDISSALKDCSMQAGSVYTCKSRTVVDQGNQGNDLEKVGVAVGGGGLALVAAGLVWHFLEKPGDGTPGGGGTGGTGGTGGAGGAGGTGGAIGAGAPTVANAHIAPALAPGYAGLTMSGAF